MTEMEAIEVLNEKYRTMSMCFDIEDCKRNNQAISNAITALEEIQQYRALGTVEELREAMEKQRAKKVRFVNMRPVCKECDCDLRTWYSFCPDCGQKLDWRNENETD